MAGFLDTFRHKVLSSVARDTPAQISVGEVDDKIALGVLLWVVAEADNRFLPEEGEVIKEILRANTTIGDEDIALVMRSIEQAAKERVDLYRFTSEVSGNLVYDKKISIIEDLFRVACVDKDLDNNELEAIRKISGLFGVSHSDFIEAKIKVKKEAGLDTAGL